MEQQEHILMECGNYDQTLSSSSSSISQTMLRLIWISNFQASRRNVHKVCMPASAPSTGRHILRLDQHPMAQELLQLRV